jgi:hypothetical protein
VPDTQLKSSILRYADVPPELIVGKVPEAEQAYRAERFGPRHHLTLVRPKELKRVKQKELLAQQLGDLPAEGMKLDPRVISAPQPKKGRQYKLMPVKWEQVQALRKEHGLGRAPLHVTVGAKELEKASEFAPGIPSRAIRALPKFTTPRTWEMALHRHQAERAGEHFDLRLGDPRTGRAHSWAMRGGLPPPGQHTLAVQQPTHTIGYMDFKGRIEKGYGKGDVELAQRDKAEVLHSSKKDVRFNVYKGKENQEFALRRTKGGDWMVQNVTPSRKAGPSQLLPSSKPKYKERGVGQLNTDDPNTELQAKIDGAHVLYQFKSPGTTPRVFSYRPTERASGVIDHTQKLPGFHKRKTPSGLKDTILRGELYAVDDRGKALPAARVGGILNAGVWKSREKQKQEGRLVPVAFDVTRFKGKDVEGLPYAQKRELLAQAVGAAPWLSRPRTASTPAAKRKLIADIEAGREPSTEEGVVEWHRDKPTPVKAKFKAEKDVFVRSVFPERGTKRQGTMAGGFEFSYTKGGPVIGRVGTGMSHAMKKDMLQNPSKYEGLQARVTMQRAPMHYAPRAPAFKSFHLDQDIPPDVKTAMAKVAKEEGEKRRRSKAPLLAGLGTAAAAAPLIYAAMRKKRFSADPFLRKIQEGSGGKFVRSVSEKAPKGRARRFIDRIRHSADEMVYTGGAQPKRPKKVRAAVHHFDPETETAWVRSATTPDPHSTRAASRLNELIGENKLKEYQYFQRHAPGALPESAGVSDHVRSILKEMGLKKPPRGMKQQEEFVGKLQQRLQKQYGKGGFVLKDVGGAQASGKFPMESDDFARLWRDYSKGESKKLRAKLRAQGGEFAQSSDWDKFYTAAKKDPAYAGRVLEDIMRNPKAALSQKKVQFERPGVLGRLASKLVGNPASEEIRVHSFAGQVDPSLASPRYNPLSLLRRKKMREASKYVQDIVDKLPEQHRRTSFAFDVAPVKGGGFKIIESNPMGARSGLLDPGKQPLMSPMLRRFYTGQFGKGFSGGAALAGGAAAGGAAAGGTALGQHLAGQPAPAQQPAQAAPQAAQAAPQQAAPPAPAVPRRRPLPVQQKAAAAPTGLYKGKPASTDSTKFKLDFQGIPISVDRPRGFVMMGRDEKGKPWSRRYRYDYGHIPRTLGGDHDGLDVFIGPKKKSEHAFWAIQRKPDGTFDEYKVFLGFDNRDEAIAAYRAHIPKKLFSGLMTMKVEMMKAMLGKNPQQHIKVAMLLELAKLMEAKQ